MVTVPQPRRGALDPDAVRAVSALADATRAQLYALVSDATEPVTREQAAAGVGISRKLAAFHLDKLVGAGLLAADYQRTGRVRTLGRVPKSYRRAKLRVDISLPDRRPVVLAALLLDGIASAGPSEPARDAVLRTAEAAGREIGAAARSTVRAGRLGPERALALAEDALRERGYEPVRESPTTLRLRNCPFQPLTEHATELVCAINHHLLSGVTNGIQADIAQAVLDPRTGQCCVEIRAAAAAR